MQFTWTETEDGGTPVVHTLTWDDAQQDAASLQSIQSLLRLPPEVLSPLFSSLPVAALAVWEEKFSEPKDVLPGGTIATKDEVCLSVDADGFVYRDGLRLAGVAVAKLRRIGSTIYGLGKTDNAWWQYNNTNWLKVNMALAQASMFS